MRNTTLAAIILVGGGLLFMASFFHFFLGYKIVNNTMVDANTGAELARLVRIIWIFSSILMALCGTWGMFIGISIRKNLRYARKQALSLGLGITVFGIYGFTNPFPNYQLGIFLILGLLIMIPGLFLSKKQGPYI